jgi:hypothetical protein
MSQTGYTPIQLYRSATASTAPIAGNLAAGELAINTNDGKLYYKDSAGVVQTIASKAGASGDVVGPASATDNAIVRFDGTTGKLIQNSSVTIADDGTTIISVNSSTAALRITQIGAGNALLVEDSANPDSTPFVIDAGGAVGMGGTTVPAGNGFYNSKNITGAVSAYANNTVATIQSDVVSIAAGYRSVIGTASSVSLNTLYHFVASQGTFSGATSFQAGFYSDSNLIGSTANHGFYAANTAAVTGGKTAYGFYSNINTATGGGAAWGFYANGTANNYFGGNVAIGRATPTVSLDVNGSLALRAPSTVNAATYTVAVTDSSLRFTTTNCTVTLPAAASFTGRILYLNTITANSVTSASSNVIPLGSDTAGTAIFAATAGKFAMIQSNGTNWITMMAN